MGRVPARGATPHAPGLARLDVRGVDPQIRPIALDLAVEEGAHTLIQFAAQPADLALGDAGHAQRLDQVVHGSSGDPLDVRLLEATWPLRDMRDRKAQA
jgi:hypothetical protein